jgi:hypothetical protein
LDAGKTCQHIICHRAGDDRWTGFDVTTCYGIHFDPFNTKNLFISPMSVCSKSTDGRQTWKNWIAGRPRRLPKLDPLDARRRHWHGLASEFRKVRG